MSTNQELNKGPIKVKIKAGELIIECDKFKIESRGSNTVETKLYIDGKPLTGCHDLKLEMVAGELPKLTLGVWTRYFGIGEEEKHG